MRPPLSLGAERRISKLDQARRLSGRTQERATNLFDRLKFNRIYDSLQRTLGVMVADGWDVMPYDGSTYQESYEYEEWAESVGLPHLGWGAFRSVFDLGGGRVLKIDHGHGRLTDGFIEWNGEPSGVNLAEWRMWETASPRQRRWMVPVIDVDTEGLGRWLVMEKAMPLATWDTEDQGGSNERMLAAMKRIPEQAYAIADQLDIPRMQVNPYNLDTRFRMLDYGTRSDSPGYGP